MHGVQRVMEFSDVAISVRSEALRRQAQQALSGGAQWTGAGPPPAFDVYETAESVVVVVDLPGVGPEALAVSLLDRGVVVRGERPGHLPRGSDVRPHRLEIVSGPFELTVRLPVEVEAEGARAACRHGVVTVTLPRRRRPGGDG